MHTVPCHSFVLDLTTRLQKYLYFTTTHFHPFPITPRLTLICSIYNSTHGCNWLWQDVKHHSPVLNDTLTNNYSLLQAELEQPELTRASTRGLLCGMSPCRTNYRHFHSGGKCYKNYGFMVKTLYRWTVGCMSHRLLGP